MKFREVRESSGLRFHYRDIIKAKKNMIEFEIVSMNSEDDKEGFYILVRDLNSGISFNSLWRGMYFMSKDSAYKFCEDVADYYKKKRIREGVGAKGDEMANSRLDDFLREHKEYVAMNR